MLFQTPEIQSLLIRGRYAGAQRWAAEAHLARLSMATRRGAIASLPARILARLGVGRRADPVGCDAYPRLS